MIHSIASDARMEIKTAIQCHTHGAYSEVDDWDDSDSGQ